MDLFARGDAEKMTRKLNDYLRASSEIEAEFTSYLGSGEKRLKCAFLLTHFIGNIDYYILNQSIIGKQHIHQFIKFMSHRINRTERKGSKTDWGCTIGAGKHGLYSRIEPESWFYHFLLNILQQIA